MDYRAGVFIVLLLVLFGVGSGSVAAQPENNTTVAWDTNADFNNGSLILLATRNGKLLLEPPSTALIDGYERSNLNNSTLNYTGDTTEFSIDGSACIGCCWRNHRHHNRHATELIHSEWEVDIGPISGIEAPILGRLAGADFDWYEVYQLDQEECEHVAEMREILQSR